MNAEQYQDRRLMRLLQIRQFREDKKTCSPIQLGHYTKMIKENQRLLAHYRRQYYG